MPFERAQSNSTATKKLKFQMNCMGRIFRTSREWLGICRNAEHNNEHNKRKLKWKKKTTTRKRDSDTKLFYRHRFNYALCNQFIWCSFLVGGGGVPSFSLAHSHTLSPSCDSVAFSAVVVVVCRARIFATFGWLCARVDVLFRMKQHSLNRYFLNWYLLFCV